MEDNWISVDVQLPVQERYYDVKYSNGETDVKPFRIRHPNINGFMTLDTITHWRECTDEQDFEID